MKTRPRLPLVRILGVLFLPAILAAQVAPAPAPDAATLARYDKNKNGRLDADEVRALESDQKKVPVSSTASAESDVPITLSPFEVVADSKG